MLFKAFSVLFHLLLMELFSRVSAQDCTLSYTYTPCNGQNQRYAVSYFTDAACTAVPPVARPMPCRVECNGGEILKAPNTSCITCPQGTYSTRDTIWQNMIELPQSTYTVCEGLMCQPWEARDGILNSGSQTYNNASLGNVVTTLVFPFETVTDSVLTFEYRTSSEVYDTFTARLDGNALAFRRGQYSDSGIMHSFRRISFPVSPPGMHMIAFSYSKDGDTSDGTDRIYIRYLRIENTTRASDFCVPCLEGLYSRSGASQCSKCEPGFIPNTDRSGCTPCADPTIQYATPGMAKCQTRPDCIKQVDFYINASECEPDTSLATARYVKNAASHCRDINDIAGQTFRQSCSMCQPGQERSKAGIDGKSTSDTRCSVCESGQYSDGYGECTPCEAGTAAVKVVEYNVRSIVDGVIPGVKVTCFDSDTCPPWNKIISTEGYFGPHGASDGLSGQGKELALMTTDRLGHNGWSLNVSLDLTFYAVGTFSLTYGFIYADNDDEALFGLSLLLFIEDSHGTIRGIELDTFPMVWDDHERMTQSVSIPPGPQRITLQITTPPHNDAFFRLVIFEMNAMMVEEGLATGCVRCPAGTTCAERSDHFQACPPGMTSDAGSSFCGKCPEGTIAPVPASSQCLACPTASYLPENLQTNAAKTSCTAHCDFTFVDPDGDHVYFSVGHSGRFDDFEMEDNGPIYVDNGTLDEIMDQRGEADAHNVRRLYYNLCSPLHSLSRPQGCVGDPRAQACLRTNDDTSVTLARRATQELNRDQPMTGFRVIMSDGDVCQLGNESYPNITKTLTLNYICSGDVGLHYTVLENSECTTTIMVETIQACAMCRNEYFVPVPSSVCIPLSGHEGQREVRYELAPRFRGCRGDPPDPVNETCLLCVEQDYIKTLSPCDGQWQQMYFTVKANSTCIPGPYSPMGKANNSNVVACTLEVSGGNNRILVISLCVAFVTLFVLLAVIYFVVRNNRLLKHKYEVLQSMQTEMPGKSPPLSPRHEEMEGKPFSPHAKDRRPKDISTDSLSK